MEILSFPFFQNALIGIILIAISSAIIGVYIMTKRMVFIAGGITHACFGGLGLGYFLGMNPVVMATLFAIGGSLGVEWLTSVNKVRKDSAIAVIWALGMAMGILFIFMTDGFVPELNSFLFGNVLTINKTDLYICVGFAITLILFFIIFFKLIIAISFDLDFARTRHLPVIKMNLVMTVFVAVGIVLTIRMIGIMLLISLISVPQMTAELFCYRYSKMLWTSILLSVTAGIAGLWIAYMISVPASATIVLLLIFTYFAASIIKKIKLKY